MHFMHAQFAENVSSDNVKSCPFITADMAHKSAIHLQGEFVRRITRAGETVQTSSNYYSQLNLLNVTDDGMWQMSQV